MRAFSHWHGMSPHIHRGACLESTHKRRGNDEEKCNKETGVRFHSTLTKPVWLMICVITNTHTHSIHRYTFSKGLVERLKAKWNNSTCYLSRDSTTPISPLFRFVPMWKEKGNKKPCTSFHSNGVKRMEDTGASYKTRHDFTTPLNIKNPFPKLQNSKLSRLRLQQLIW